ncbi:MAG: hypothetical protein HGN29_11370 [Asgard group archaeon]|nr:hypothetical protein [Asgard group archaeon]
MKKNKKLSILIILSLLILYNVALNEGVRDSLATTSINTSSNQILLEDLVVQSPMIIDYDSDFEAYGLPGDGSLKDPFRIENYNITTTDETCLSFGGYTTKHFIIQNCFLKTDTNSSIILGAEQNMDEGSIIIKNNVIISIAGASGLTIKGKIEGGVYKNDIFSLDCGIELQEPFTYVQNNKIVAALGIRLVNSLGSSLIGNICNETSEIGIHIVNSNGTSIINNNCSNNVDTGILAENSHDLVINNNYLVDNFFGMRIIGSSGSVINNNHFNGSTSYGLSMSLSVGLNKIYHNAFYDNNLDGTTIQALDDAGDQWYDDVLLEGNYWNDFTGATSSSYPIDGAAGSVDLYPLDFIPVISEYSTVFISYILIALFSAIPLVAYSKKRK